MASSASRPERQSTTWIVAAIVLVGGAAPLVLYGWLFGRIATATPQEAKTLLRREVEPAVLIDVRPNQAFLAGHIDGAVNWSLEEILAATGPDAMPASFRGKTLLLVCEVGMDSRRAAGHLAEIGVEGAWNVRGGIQEWVRSTTEALGRQCPWQSMAQAIAFTEPPKGEVFDRWRVAPDRVTAFPFRRSPLWEQAVAVLAFFVIKPVYTLLALAVVILLWNSRDADLAALRWGMIFFFLGENACAANYFLFKETSYLAEYLHSCGMLLCFGFTAFAVLEGIDRRILMLSDPGRRCAAVGLCRACMKHADVPCGLKQTFYLVIPALIVIALMLPVADWQDNSYTTLVFGQLYHYAHLRVYQQFENWYCAAAAIAMFAASLAILALKKHNPIAPAKIALAAGIGPLGFGMLRMVLGGAYDQNRVWYLFWEETTELLFILGVCFVLWTFRGTLLPASPARPRELAKDDGAGGQVSDESAVG